MLRKPIILLATSDPPRSREFYEGTLGLTFVRDDGPALVFDIDGCPLRIQKVEEVRAAEYTVLGWLVEDIEAAVRALRSRGVVFETYAQLDQDENSIWTSPSGARVAWFRDPDGNTLSVTQG